MAIINNNQSVLSELLMQQGMQQLQKARQGGLLGGGQNLNYGLLGALQGIQPFMGYTKTPVSAGQVLAGAGAGYMSGKQLGQQQTMSDIMNTLKLSEMIRPPKPTGRDQKIEGLVQRGVPYNKAVDIVDNNLKIEYNQDTKTFSVFNPTTNKIETFGGPVSNGGTYLSQDASQITQAIEEGQKEYKPSLLPQDLTPQQVKEFKQTITDVEQIVPTLEEIIGDVKNTFGLGAMFEKIKTSAAGLTPDFIDKFLVNPDVVKARQKYLTFKKEITKTFVNNPRIPVAEQQLVQNLLPDESSIFQDPNAAAIALQQVQDVIEGYKNKSQTQLGMATDSESKITGTGSQIDPFYPKSENDIANYQSGQYFYWNGELRRRK
tara:strand:- start:2929 stop:4053 length:1125 start_codon:yes stop_codon:yes gene_type:complete